MPNRSVYDPLQRGGSSGAFVYLAYILPALKLSGPHPNRIEREDISFPTPILCGVPDYLGRLYTSIRQGHCSQKTLL